MVKSNNGLSAGSNVRVKEHTIPHAQKLAVIQKVGRATEAWPLPPGTNCSTALWDATWHPSPQWGHPPCPCLCSLLVAWIRTPNLKLVAVSPRLSLKFSTFWVWLQISKVLNQTTLVLRDFCLPGIFFPHRFCWEKLLKKFFFPHREPTTFGTGRFAFGHGTHEQCVQRDTECCLLPTFNHANSNRPSKPGQSKYLLGTTLELRPQSYSW